MSDALIIAAAKTVDNVGSQQHCLQLEEQIQQLGIPLHELVIEPLSADWHSPEPDNHFRSGCAPIEALARARQLIEQGEQAVLISGEDLLKSGYERNERLRLMAVYGNDYPLTEAYNDLAEHFLKQHAIDEAHFRELAHCLFENYKLSYRNTLADDYRPELLPDERWHRPITSLFRGVDCANPLVDFSGRMLICSTELAERLQVPANESIQIKGVGLGRLAGDGRDYIDRIASYDHLREAYLQCCAQSDIDFAARFRAGEALLEAYTCYPVVPMAFLLVSGLVDLLEEIPAFLEQHSITVTGGMNLARAPWNNPALNGLISMHHRLLAGDEQFGLVHGNGGLGYRQGVALLARYPAAG
ncbi:hypothetical protein [Marinobacterium arenosum]|uniref:hypothetical protein n=1 Tax=Marinobacterium arenosum TaxID=2862496 RepID=UPI001C984120|nr:hypothetical protein [Marinobacterium arenosum]MBY4678322.1 hypothetical protein [Marinobacterium arenosum]